MTDLATRGDAAHALLTLLVAHEHGPQPEFGLWEYMTGSGEQGWGVTLVLRDSIGAFEYWRRTLDLPPQGFDYDSCHHTVWLRATGEYEGVPVQLFAMAEVPAPDDTER